ncbi:MAG: hypothetical protein LBB63_01625 [Holosporaceae bacterium]|jgi:hypothetical protein|nr:hypothetical protein [Holosporaceae bacterium]
MGNYFEESGGEKQLAYVWLISADSIFKSNMKGYEEYSRFYGMEFSMSRVSLFDGEKTSDSAVSAKNVKIYIPTGTHCAMIQSRMAKKVVIPKISMKRIATLAERTETLEEKEFSQCIIHSFSRAFSDNREEISFTFSCLSFSDSYTSIKNDGTNGGKAAVKVDFAAWKIDDQ